MDIGWKCKPVFTHEVRPLFLQDGFRFVSLFLKLCSALVFVRKGLLAFNNGGGVQLNKRIQYAN